MGSTLLPKPSTGHPRLEYNLSPYSRYTLDGSISYYGTPSASALNLPSTLFHQSEFPRSAWPFTMPERSSSDGKTWLKTPAPIKRLFARFPLVKYPDNALPNRTHLDRSRTTLFVFDIPKPSIDDGLIPEPSFNPSCLKWQTYLHFARVSFSTQPSTNHASPTGSLPFLLPSDSLLPIPSTKLEKWILDNSSQPQSVNPSSQNSRSQIYSTLLSQSIRRAWLYTLYLDANYAENLTSLYVTHTTTNTAVRTTLSYQLRAAATAELLNVPEGTNVIDIERIHRDAERAWEALSTLLGEREWFPQYQEEEEGGVENPGMFDAEVFAYSYLVLDERMGMKESRLARGLQRWQNLTEHREKIVQGYYK